MIQHSFEKDCFIGGWYMPENICDDIINFYHSYPDKHQAGATGDTKTKEINNTVKKSTDLYCHYEVIGFHIPEYLKNLKECCNNYFKQYEQATNVSTFSLENNIQIQHYKPNEGFYDWHFENAGYDKNAKRHLVFMTYLNDVENGGTDFLYQKITTPAKKGLTIIWPATWTHTHKGHISNTQEKYIITGWFSYVN